MKFSIATLTIFLAAAGLPLGVAAGAPGQENAACESEWLGGDFVTFSCSLPARAAAQRWRFKADFSGGHDDTSASMQLALDDQPLACDADSKTRLFAEDGDISLVCHFRAQAKPGERRLLVVKLLWSHAQYERTEFVAE